MKPIQAIINTLFALIMLTFMHCDKNEPELEKLPSATQSGKNTFGCLVNGKAWYTFNYNDVHSDYQLGSLHIGAIVYEPTQSIGINLSEKPGDLPLSTGSYGLTTIDPYQPWVTFSYSSNCIFGGSSNDKIDTLEGSITITRFDNQKYIISGTFEFTLSHQGCETLKVTNGRFDMDYAP